MLSVLTVIWFASLILYAWIYVAWDKGIYMRVSLFGLLLRCTSLMWPWLKRIQSLLHINQLYFGLPVLWLCYIYLHTMLVFYPLFYRLSHLAVSCLLFICLDPWICIFRFRAWVVVESSTVDRAFLWAGRLVPVHRAGPSFWFTRSTSSSWAFCAYLVYPTFGLVYDKRYM